MSDNNLIVPAAAIVALIAILAGVVIARPDQVGVLVPIIGMVVLALVGVIRGEKAVSTSQQAAARAEITSEKADAVAEHVSIKADELHQIVNSRMDELLKLTREAAERKGRADAEAGDGHGTLTDA